MRTVLVAMSLAVGLAACSSPNTAADNEKTWHRPADSNQTASADASSVSTEPRTADAAKVAAQRFFDAYAAGDWAGHWDDWTEAGKAVFSRADYVKFRTGCQVVTGLPFTIKSARLEGDDRAVLNVERGGILRSYEVRHENGKWRYQPDAEALAGYRLGADALLAKNHAEGRCIS